ncbi:unnamed protein product [Durusdinium trenchii]|uniref:Ribosomal RNA-processing protein 14/surfeit locus protein 6 C-terminal domain-containing protein n=1 Tax=Durusdinium trenchii TaxID=1381693 RepID=A0ABP0NNT7_9DINO
MSPQPEKHGDALLEETRLRCQRINHYLDLIPARFYLSHEVAAGNVKAKNKWAHLDPFQAKSTTEILKSQGAQISGGAQGGKNKNKKKNKKSATRTASSSDPTEPTGRGALVAKLNRRIEELKEERRVRQSNQDKAKAEEIRKGKETTPTSSRKTNTLEGKRRKLEEDPDAAEPEAGRLSFEASGQLPFEAGVGQRGQKVRKLQADLRKQEAQALKLKEAESQGRGEDVRKEFAYQKALQRARGEKVHDDVSKLRKVQKTMEMKKKKGQERWEAKIESDKQKVEEQQAQRKENLKNRGTKKKTKMQQRMGFEGERTGKLNSGPY